MRRRMLWAAGAAVIFLLALRAQEPAGRGRREGEPPHMRQGEVGWRLAPSEQRYAVIDGQHLKEYVEQLCAISRRYRDQGHQFWGRIIGTEADTKNADAGEIPADRPLRRARAAARPASAVDAAIVERDRVGQRKNAAAGDCTADVPGGGYARGRAGSGSGIRRDGKQRRPGALARRARESGFLL